MEVEFRSEEEEQKRKLIEKHNKHLYIMNVIMKQRKIRRINEKHTLEAQKELEKKLAEDGAASRKKEFLDNLNQENYNICNFTISNWRSELTKEQADLLPKDFVLKISIERLIELINEYLSQENIETDKFNEIKLQRYLQTNKTRTFLIISLQKLFRGYICRKKFGETIKTRLFIMRDDATSEIYYYDDLYKIVRRPIRFIHERYGLFYRNMFNCAREPTKGIPYYVNHYLKLIQFYQPSDTLLCGYCNVDFVVLSCQPCGDSFCSRCFNMLHSKGSSLCHKRSQLEGYLQINIEKRLICNICYRLTPMYICGGDSYFETCKKKYCYWCAYKYEPDDDHQCTLYEIEGC